MKQMIVTIDKDGKVSIKTSGFEGDACLKETKKLEEELGIVSDRQRSPDFYKVKRSSNVRVSR